MDFLWFRSIVKQKLATQSARFFLPQLPPSHFNLDMSGFISMPFLSKLSQNSGIGPKLKLFNRAFNWSLISMSFLHKKHLKTVCKSVNFTVIRTVNSIYSLSLSDQQIVSNINEKHLRSAFLIYYHSKNVNDALDFFIFYAFFLAVLRPGEKYVSRKIISWWTNKSTVECEKCEFFKR